MNKTRIVLFAFAAISLISMAAISSKKKTFHLPNKSKVLER